MTREEAYNRIDAIIAKHEIDDEYVTITNSKDYDALRIARKTLEQEPSEDVAKECYEDLCRYFGDAKDILKNREDFKAWLDRIKWHIHKAEELSAENDDLRDQLAMRDRFQKQEPCLRKGEPMDDLISRQAALASIKNLYPDMPIADIFGARRKWLEKYAPYFECENAIEQLLSVNPVSNTSIQITEEEKYGRFN